MTIKSNDSGDECHISHTMQKSGVVKGALDEFAHKKHDRVSNLQLTSATGKVQYTTIITKRR